MEFKLEQETVEISLSDKDFKERDAESRIYLNRIHEIQSGAELNSIVDVDSV